MPWQLWVVTVLLGLEGLLSNFPMMFTQPVAAFWLAAKIFFITGFFLRWRPVYVINLIVGSLHVLAFATIAPVVALINLVLVVLVASTASYFFGARKIDVGL
jgi:hypothetical protein